MVMNNKFDNMRINSDGTVSKGYIPLGMEKLNTAPSSIRFSNISDSVRHVAFYQSNSEIDSSKAVAISSIEAIAQWFLYHCSVSNKKLQKLCYYAYCWFIVFHNDVEAANDGRITTLCEDKFQAWIHGPVCPKLYYKYRENGWADIPQSKLKPQLTQDIESLLEQVLDAYGGFSADQLEALSHTEKPWQNARRGIGAGEACTNEISTYDILLYYSSLR